MRYLGGKSKIRKQVAAFLEEVRKPGQPYLEPFVGGGWVLQEMTGERIASDGNEALIAMYQALQQGWEPPEFVSEEEYAHHKAARDPTDPVTSFCAFGYSFAGKWFGGYASHTDPKAKVGDPRKSLLKQLPAIRDVKFEHRMFNELKPEGMLVYCDPPYSNTTAYGAFDGFDHELFWQTMREWSKNNTVVISEYSAPEDFVCVAEFTSRMGLTTEGGARTQRVERVFMYSQDLC